MGGNLLESERGKVSLKPGWKPPALCEWEEFSLEWRREVATRLNSKLDLWGLPWWHSG